ncbi:hypothetical protein Gotur_017184 [Gossypium turneri]
MVWSSHDEVQSLLKKFYQVPEMEHNKKSMKLETYYKEKASKSQDQLKKQNRKTKEVKDWLNDNINANDIKGKARSKIRSEIGLTYHDPWIATIGDDLVALAVQVFPLTFNNEYPHIMAIQVLYLSQGYQDSLTVTACVLLQHQGRQCLYLVMIAPKVFLLLT